MHKSLKDELHDVISGKNQVRFGTLIQTVAHYLKNGAGTSSNTQGQKHLRKKEEEKLDSFITEKELWIYDIDFTQYVSEGAEQKVYLKDSEHVIKLNDGIYYKLWADYFNNLLLHNFFFSDTAYKLVGFTKDQDSMYAVV